MVFHPPHQGFQAKTISETSPKDRVFEFYKLYLPSALAIASDFWRVTVIGVIAASRGSVEVGRQ